MHDTHVKRGSSRIAGCEVCEVVAHVAHSAKDDGHPESEVAELLQPRGAACRCTVGRAAPFQYTRNVRMQPRMGRSCSVRSSWLSGESVSSGSGAV